MRNLWEKKSSSFPGTFRVWCLGVGKTDEDFKNFKEVEMLVLSRKKDEQIVINENIVITIVDIRGDKVRLGVEAPKEVPVHRREVYDAIKRYEPEGTVWSQDFAPIVIKLYRLILVTGLMTISI